MKHVLLNVDDCTGCGACSANCKKNAIEFFEDSEGFKHPSINDQLCNDCGACKSRCPINVDDNSIMSKQVPLQVLAGWHLDDQIRSKSSSGGIFSALAELILSYNGRIVGAALDEFLQSKHIIISKSEELSALRGSKYVQSEIPKGIFYEIKRLLNSDIPVLFSGTPCQVSGLRNFLIKDYSSLICVDIVCHGVPSPRIWKESIRSYQKTHGKVCGISFRDKTNGWKNFQIKIEHTNQNHKIIHPLKLAHLTAFWFNYGLRPSCYNCKFCTTYRSGDITLGDFWKVHLSYPEYDKDDKGTSLILVNSIKGAETLSNCHSIFTGKADLATAVNGNKNLQRPSIRPPERDHFFGDFNKMNFSRLSMKYELDRSEPPILGRKIREKSRNLWKIIKEKFIA